MNKAVIAAVAVILAAGLGYWFLAGDDGSSAAPLAPESASPDSPAARAVPPASRASSPADAPQRTPSASDVVDAGAKPRSGQTAHVPLTPEEYVLPALFHIPRGLQRPEAKEGEPVTAAAMKQADMGSLDPSDGAYDEVVEAHQLFHALEKDFLARGKVTADDWTELLKTYAPAKEAMLERTVKLSADGHAEESESMLLEWGALESGYAAKVEK